MTKEQARQSLQNTKVYVAGKSKEIQKKLFKLGFIWEEGSNYVKNTDFPFLFVGPSAITYEDDMNIFSEHPNKEVTANYILSLDCEEEKPQYQFKPFDRVLVRDTNGGIWFAAFYSHQSKGKFATASGFVWNQCIPYEGNEELIGTSNRPK